MTDELVRQHRPRKKCPHLAAELIDGHQEDAAEEMLIRLLPWARNVARSAGRLAPPKRRRV